MRAGGSPPTILVDYGKDVGGIPYFVVESESGSPVLRSAYSEGLPYMGASGDGTPSTSGAGDQSRVDDLTVTSTGRWTTGFIQGGERYERITLASPGTIRLSSVGIRFTAVRTDGNDYRGWFDSSRPPSTASGTTGRTPRNSTNCQPVPCRHLGSSPAEPSRPVWVSWVSPPGRELDRLRDVLRDKGIEQDTGWVVRASSTSGYLFVLGNATETVDSPVILQEIAVAGPPSSRSSVTSPFLHPLTPAVGTT